MILSRYYFSKAWTYIHANAVIAGLISGVAIASFHAALYGISLRSFWGIMLFSLLHSFAMAYTISFYTEILNKKIQIKWVKVPSLFVLGFFGTVLATEFSYWLHSVTFGGVYLLFGHASQIIINFSICIISSAVVLLYESQRITYRNHFQKREIEILKLKQLKMKEELEALQSKINPHFLYNSLNTIAALVYDQAGLAEELTLKLSKLFRYSINYGQQNFSSIRDELEMITIFMEIEQIRIGERFDFVVKVEPQLLDLFIPRFLLQPLVENALRHGLADHSDHGLIELEIIKKGKQLKITISDNGKAFPQQVIGGQGFQNTYEKLELLFPNQYEFKLISEPKKQVLLVLPVKTKPAELDTDERHKAIGPLAAPQ